jgi:DNA gyrase subunit A
LIDNWERIDDVSVDDLMQIVPGPDFPTGGIIIGRSGIRSAFETGRGSITIRARAEFEEIRRDREAIVIHEIPYQVNKSTLLERIGELVRAKQIEGIGEMRDESDRSGMRIVIELRRDATPEVVLNQLFRFTQLQASFGVNMLALDGGRPRQMGLKDALACFIAFREEVILRRARFELGKARDRAHLLVGLAIAVANIDEVIRLIRASPDAATARVGLMERHWPAADVLRCWAITVCRTALTWVSALAMHSATSSMLATAAVLLLIWSTNHQRGTVARMLCSVVSRARS